MQNEIARQAREKFANHVQSIAFNLTLSRSMIGALAMIRDFNGYGCAHDDMEWGEIKRIYGPRIDGLFVPLMRAVERRGLVVHNPLPEGKKMHECPSHVFYQLTKAGELVCELLVEAGLIPARVEEKKLSRRKKAA